MQGGVLDEFVVDLGQLVGQGGTRRPHDLSHRRLLEGVRPKVRLGDQTRHVALQVAMRSAFMGRAMYASARTRNSRFVVRGAYVFRPNDCPNVFVALVLFVNDGDHHRAELEIGADVVLVF